MVYRLDPVTLEVTQAIHNISSRLVLPSITRLRRCGLVTCKQRGHGDRCQNGRSERPSVLDDRKRTEEVRPLQPRELVQTMPRTPFTSVVLVKRA